MKKQEWQRCLHQLLEVGLEQPAKNGKQKNIYEDEFEDVPLDDSDDQIEESSGEQQDTTQQFYSSIVMPQTKAPYNKSLPPLKLTPTFINGFVCLESTQNVLYTAPDSILFAAATVGVTMNTTTREQKYFGWLTETDNSGSNYQKHHKFQIVCLAKKDNVVATGSTGINPQICLWDCNTMEPIAKAYQGKNTKAAACLCFYQDTMFISVYRQTKQSNFIVIWSLDGKKLLSCRVDGSIYGVATNNEQIAVASSQGASLFKYEDGQLKRITGNKQYSTSVCYFMDRAVFGCPDGKIISKQRQYRLHDGCIVTLMSQSNALYTAGTDNILRLWDQNMVMMREIQLESCARSIDAHSGSLLIAMQNGKIVQYKDKMRTLMNSHYAGQVCGLCYDKKQKTFISAGDDNKILRFDFSSRQVSEQHIVSQVKKRNKKYQKQTLYCSQQCRAIDIYNGVLAYGTKYGKIYLLQKKEAIEAASLKDRIMCLKFSQNGKILAVGCCDDCVYVFDLLKDGLSLRCRLFGHEGDVCSIDFSQDCGYIRTCSMVGELRYWDLAAHKQIIMNSPKQSREDKQKIKQLTWCELSKFSYETKLLWDEVKDNEFVNVVKLSNKKTYIAVGEDDNCVRIYLNPCIEGRFIRYRVHGGNVMNICWSDDDQFLATVGGPDRCLILWKVIYE